MRDSTLHPPDRSCGCRAAYPWHPPGSLRLAASRKKTNQQNKKSPKPARHVLWGISSPQCECPSWPRLHASRGIAPGDEGCFPPSLAPGRWRGSVSCCFPWCSEPGLSSIHPQRPIFSERWGPACGKQSAKAPQHSCVEWWHCHVLLCPSEGLRCILPPAWKPLLLALLS